ncbi:TIGR00725 family protein [Bradyrhizobium sp. U87765 SZCCT0131]|uniref:TIGR00725 family protein n=1 Tax=unclassified Bradyrhizobium TaxID=2631580 RepID=UPI001BAD2746|nr:MULTISPECIES: TIGR00725 family protein [unclassified Bradyrhizobium]MBR1216886.1 TIGR00725 family protein [Bradyrhizobium sp. U87765 SZCCT0131]MBR1259358.1 TIGR00725 family protein [Bradyrhizobium sp. U87765 SZCCT0134]MBR1305499.1 TIGR00725 family protein [Bradyrhizobium sp. U87765 SZCCT0110]MBR1321866.1 TIGR00725 family protein [Bradyrhizobium sp. U87765 SZCCT0109]MBR1350856.1 TIGR00725 family protein [Bradyrhizobium sp. U87765 SZCCT0048]
MTTALRWHPQAAILSNGDRTFDPAALRWTEAPPPAEAGEAVSPVAALLRFAPTRRLRRVPIGIIGPREATDAQCALAEALGKALARHGLQMLCGGKNGVMEAACRGHAAGGGLPVGLLPDEEWDAANPYVAIPIATGIGPARNAIIARACLALVAVGGGVGTLSEMALGLQFRRLVLALADAPQVEAVPRLGSMDEALERIAARVLALDGHM